MNPHPTDTSEWLAHEAVRLADGDYTLAMVRLGHAQAALALWGDGPANDNARGEWDHG